MPKSVFNKSLPSHTILSSTILSLSLLAGCANSPEQPLSNETAEFQPATQTESTVVSVQEQGATGTEKTEKADNTTTHEVKTEPEASSETETKTNITSEQKEPAATENTQTAEPPVATEKSAAPIIAITSSPDSAQTPNTPTARSENDIGNSYGIWTLKKADNGFCKLSTPTLQTSTSNNEYSSQIWMDIEEQRIVVNAFMSMDIAHPKTGIQIDNQTLVPFTEKLYSTRAVVTGNLTTELSQGNQLHIFINGKEVGKQVLKRDVSLTNMNSAINALQSCGK